MGRREIMSMYCVLDHAALIATLTQYVRTNASVRRTPTPQTQKVA